MRGNNAFSNCNASCESVFGLGQEEVLQENCILAIPPSLAFVSPCLTVLLVKMSRVYTQICV